MIVLSPPWQQSALLVRKFLVRQCLDIPKTQIRRAHNVPILTHHRVYERKGVGRVLSPEGYDTAWSQYQSHLVYRLNQLTEGKANANTTTRNLILTCARQAEHATLFNYASMAHNNHLFFSTMSPNPPPMPVSLTDRINSSFSSLESLRVTFLATADAMFGPGFVWLVKRNKVVDNQPELAILNTYIAGSPYPGAHFRRQPFDISTLTSNVGPNMHPDSFALLQKAQYAGKFGSHSRGQAALAPGGEDLDILLGVNTWQHVYLRDHGVGGKRDYLMAWWDSIDWEVVSNNAGDVSTPRRGPSHKGGGYRADGLGM